MKTYISGPLAGAPHVSREEKVARFGRAAILLAEQGLDPLDPNDVIAECGKIDCGDANGHAWDCWLRYDLIAMLQGCDSLALLPDWQDSKGARLEYLIAGELGWEIYDLSDDSYATQRILGEI